MKKVLPVAIAIISLLLFLNPPTLGKTTKISYSETTNDNYISHPTPPSANFNIYKNDDYNLIIEYPKRGPNFYRRTVDCGNFISDDLEIVIDNLVFAQILDWDKSIGEYFKSQGAQNLYNVSAIFDSGANQALLLNDLKSEWEGEKEAPFSNISSIYLKDGKLFLVESASNVLNDGCVNRSTGWRLENHLRFY